MHDERNPAYLMLEKTNYLKAISTRTLIYGFCTTDSSLILKSRLSSREDTALIAIKRRIQILSMKATVLSNVGSKGKSKMDRRKPTKTDIKQLNIVSKIYNFLNTVGCPDSPFFGLISVYTI